MSIKTDGGPAFPYISGNAKGFNAVLGNVTLRDYFAAKALQGMLAALPDESPYNPDVLSFNAYQISDAMLAERDK